MQIIVASLVRHLLTFAAGSLIAHGYDQHDTANLMSAAEPFIGGAILYGASQMWSIIDKVKR